MFVMWMVAFGLIIDVSTVRVSNSNLHSSHAKWFVRVLLKNYDAVDVPEDLTLRCYHFLLLPFLRVQNSFEAAIQYLGRKSGRDSTNDRIGLHNTITECLAIGTLQCKFKRHCTLEGELLVWNNDSGQIEPFYKIRRHVKRSGRFFGCAQDLPAPVHEKLMIMLYDLLLLDDIVCFRDTHDKRRQRLWSTVRCIPGRAEIGSREKIQFGSEHSLHSLRRLFAQVISQNTPRSQHCMWPQTKSILVRITCPEQIASATRRLRPG
jgi:hypothetical protein